VVLLFRHLAGLVEVSWISDGLHPLLKLRVHLSTNRQFLPVIEDLDLKTLLFVLSLVPEEAALAEVGFEEDVGSVWDHMEICVVHPLQEVSNLGVVGRVDQVSGGVIGLERREGLGGIG
jgi:hypothetical protein